MEHVEDRHDFIEIPITDELRRFEDSLRSQSITQLGAMGAAIQAEFARRGFQVDFQQMRTRP